jgi:hypothetical protein
MNRIRLSLTGVGEVLTEAAEKKLEKVDNYTVPTCNNGNTVEFYNDLGVDIPEELLEKLKHQDEGIKLEDEDYEQVTSDILIYADDIKLVVTDYESTTIFLKGGLNVTVLESADQIDAYIDFLTRGKLEKIKDYILTIIKKIKINN